MVSFLKNRILLAAVFLAIILALGASVYVRMVNEQEKINQETRQIHPPCLADDEHADYVKDNRSSPILPLTLLIKDKETQKEKVRFVIDNATDNEGLLDFYKCAIYVSRYFKGSQQRYELWKYNYSGKGIKIMVFDEYDAKGMSIMESAHASYYPAFKIDETETHLALIRSWYGKLEEHALVIKNLKTMEDEYVVTLKELVEKYKIEPATIDLDYWGEKRFGTGDIIGFHFLNSERTYFGLNLVTGQIEKEQ